MTIYVMVALFLATGLTVAMLVPAARNLGHRFGILDRPGFRKNHDGAIPRTGGIAMFGGLSIAAILVVAVSISEGITAFEQRLLGSIGVGVLLVFVSGLLDDIRNLGIKIRLLVQAAAAVLVLYGAALLEVFALPWSDTPVVLPDAVRIVLAVLWLAGVTNAFNWIDGIDGLAGSTGAVVFFVYLMLAVIERDPYAAILASSSMAMCVAFFGVNYPPADLFMGDAGSYIIGFLAGITSLRLFTVASFSGNFWYATFLLVPVAVPVLDMLRVSVLRIRAGNSPTTADRSHLHHFLTDRYPTGRALIILATANLIVGGIAAIVVSALN